MSDVPQIFDLRLRRSRRARAATSYQASAFLSETVAGELIERLQAVNRIFSTAVWHGAPTSAASWITSDSVPAFAGEAGVVFSEEQLPFAAASLDLYASLLTLHAVNDLPGAITQIKRCLRPDGLFLAALFGGQTLHELKSSLAQAEIEIDGGLSPRVFPFADIRDAGALLQRAGLALPVADTDKITVHYDHPLKLLADLQGMGETNILRQRRKLFLKRRVLMRAMEIYINEFTGSDGRVRATFEVIYLTGWAPHESQQQPLKPGSGKVPLAEALKSPPSSASGGRKTVT